MRPQRIWIWFALVIVHCGQPNSDSKTEHSHPDRAAPSSAEEAVGDGIVLEASTDAGQRNGSDSEGSSDVRLEDELPVTTTSSCTPEIDVSGFTLFAPHRVLDCRPALVSDGDDFHHGSVYYTEALSDQDREDDGMPSVFSVSAAPIAPSTGRPRDRQTVLEFSIPDLLGSISIMDVSPSGRIAVRYRGFSIEDEKRNVWTSKEGIVMGRDTVEVLQPFRSVLSAVFVDEHLIVSGGMDEGSEGTYLVKEGGEIRYLGPGQYVDLVLREPLVFGRIGPAPRHGTIVIDGLRESEHGLYAWTDEQVREAVEGDTELLESDALTLFHTVSTPNNGFSSYTSHTYYRYHNEGYVTIQATYYVGGNTRDLAYSTRLRVRNKRVETVSETPLFERVSSEDVPSVGVWLDGNAASLSLRSLGNIYRVTP